MPEHDLLEGNTGALALDVFLDGLNEQIRRRFGREKQIGHSMFFHGNGSKPRAARKQNAEVLNQCDFDLAVARLRVPACR